MPWPSAGEGSRLHVKGSGVAGISIWVSSWMGFPRGKDTAVGFSIFPRGKGKGIGEELRDAGAARFGVVRLSILVCS